jgi:hypothetical protein
MKSLLISLYNGQNALAHYIAGVVVVAGSNHEARSQSYGFVSQRHRCKKYSANLSCYNAGVVAVHKFKSRRIGSAFVRN